MLFFSARKASAAEIILSFASWHHLELVALRRDNHRLCGIVGLSVMSQSLGGSSSQLLMMPVCLPLLGFLQEKGGEFKGGRRNGRSLPL